MKDDPDWAWKLVHARNDELNKLAKKLPALNKRERKIMREVINKTGLNHDGAW